MFFKINLLFFMKSNRLRLKFTILCKPNIQFPVIFSLYTFFNTAKKFNK